MPVSAQQLSFFAPCRDDSAATTAELDLALQCDPVVAINISGGKDSQALAYRVTRHLNAIRHRGERVLVHADLGDVEWRESRSVCERIAERLGLELIVVTKNGGLMERWIGRWDGIVARYAALERARVSMPWSSATWRFCTSEQKTLPIASALAKRYPRRVIVSALGLRAQESPARSKKPIAAIEPQFSVAGRTFWTWNPLLQWDLQTVWDEIERSGDVPHMAYTQWGSTRLSCCYCVLASLHDLQSAARCETNAAIFRRMVELEVRSTFSFQSGRWLADVAPSLLTASERAAVAEAKERAAVRVAAEARYPEDLLIKDGWAMRLPSSAEAREIASIRRTVGNALQVDLNYLWEEDVMARYVEIARVDTRRAA